MEKVQVTFCLVSCKWDREGLGTSGPGRDPVAAASDLLARHLDGLADALLGHRNAAGDVRHA